MMTRTPVQNPTSSPENGYLARYDRATNKSAPRRCVNTVAPWGLADTRSRLVPHLLTPILPSGITQMGGF